ncbi:MAG: response regulator [Candidatus Dormibacteraeota bacterium]|nr:response regulator [Candidatus Dormibacteraeota bacterium]MBV9524178.1 response regulator [Candidatus Dormibacteraeota bacterium]
MPTPPESAAGAVPPFDEQRRLLDAEERFRLIAEMTSDYAYSFAVDDDGRLTAEWLTDSVVRELGYTADELDRIGGPLFMVHPDDFVKASGVLENLLSGGAIPVLELRLITKAGEARWVRFHLRTVWDEQRGRLRRILGAAQDITLEHDAAEERERMNARLRQAERLDTVGHLAGGVAHDFNNLLAIISNYNDFVISGVESVRGGSAPVESLDEVTADAVQVKKAAERAAELTRRLLLLGGRSVVKPSVFNVNSLCGEVELLLRSTLGANIEVRTGYAPDVWNVDADPGQIEQVLMNLALNARDAMDGGGTLHLSTDNCVVGLGNEHRLPAGDYVRITVRDTGSGMTAETLEHALEPFYTTKAKGAGTGLGLATVHSIVAQAGGGIQLASEPGHGTEVQVLLPRSAREADAPAARAGEPPRGMGETLLLVEDEQLVRESTARILVSAGYRVIAASGMEDALTRLQPDIAAVITDVVMPGSTGKDVAERVRERLPAVRVLYLSGYPRDTLAQRGVLEPGTLLLEKPASEADLLRTLRTALDA